jgi:hypothetical protein
MKLFSFIFLLSSLAFAKNKILYKTCVNCPVKEKEVPLYDLSLQVDFKLPGAVNIETRTEDIIQFGSGEDYVVYIKRENKENVMYMITDFRTFTKRKVADRASQFSIRNGVLYIERQEPSISGVTNILYFISDFKSGIKTEIKRGYGIFQVDDY